MIKVTFGMRCVIGMVLLFAQTAAADVAPPATTRATSDAIAWLNRARDALQRPEAAVLRKRLWGELAAKYASAGDRKGLEQVVGAPDAAGHPLVDDAMRAMLWCRYSARTRDAAAAERFAAQAVALCDDAEARERMRHGLVGMLAAERNFAEAQRQAAGIADPQAQLTAFGTIVRVATELGDDVAKAAALAAAGRAAQQAGTASAEAGIEAVRTLAFIRLTAGELDAARAALGQLPSPLRARLHIGLARAANERSDLEAAKAELDAATNAMPQDLGPELVSLAARIGHQGIIERATRAAERNQQSGRVANELIWLATGVSGPSAVEKIRALIEQFKPPPSMPLPRTVVIEPAARNLIEQGQPDDAIQILNMEPESERSLAVQSLIAQAHAAAGRDKDALAAYRQLEMMASTRRKTRGAIHTTALRDARRGIAKSLVAAGQTASLREWVDQYPPIIQIDWSLLIAGELLDSTPQP